MLRKWTQQKDFSRRTEKRRREMQLLQRSRVSNGRKLSIREYPILRKDNLKLAELRPYKILRIKRAPMEEKIPQPHPFVQRPQLRKERSSKRGMANQGSRRELPNKMGDSRTRTRVQSNHKKMSALHSREATNCRRPRPKITQQERRTRIKVQTPKKTRSRTLLT